ncbi:MAG: hypothetical protein Kow0058_16420 [Roseovarius sp.]
MRDGKQTGLLDWLGLRRGADLRVARGLGPGLAVVMALLVLLALAAALGMLVQAVFGGAEARAGTGLGLGAVIVTVLGAPFVIWRAWVAQRQADVAQEGLITDRINTAVEGLGAEKTVSRVWRNVTYRLDGQIHTAFEGREERFTPPEGATEIERGKWEVANRTKPNLEVRIGAIYALERIAQDSDRDHVQIMEILCAYIRENAPAREAAPWPELEMKPGEDMGPLEADWPKRLKAFEEKQREAMKGLAPRTDIQVALEVIGRRSAHQRRLEAQWGAGGAEAAFVFDDACPDPMDYLSEEGHDPAKLKAYRAALDEWQKKLKAYRGYRLDLRNANLRGADLSGLNLNGALLDGCEIQGATARGPLLRDGEVQMRHANLRNVGLQAAMFFEPEMQGAKLWYARMQGAYLPGAQLEGAEITGAQLHGANLHDARLQGAIVRKADAETALALAAHLEEMFGDGSVVLPKGVARPGHWPRQRLSAWEFRREWHRWLANPEGYEPPKEDDH